MKVLILGCLFLVALAALQPYVWRLVSATSRLVEERRAAVLQLNNIQTIVADLEQVEQSAEATSAQLSQVLISEDEVTQAVERLEREADKRGLQLKVENIQRVTNQASDINLTQLVVTITAFGAADKLFEYIDAVEHFPEIMFTRDFVLRQAPARSKDGAVVHALNMNAVFYMNTPATVATEGDSTQNRGAPTDLGGVSPRDALYWSSVGIVGIGGVLLLGGIIMMIKRRTLI
ncbi:MAG: hypothetical protein HYR90_02140 [Candidatus Andersenbacteria bacterium]|nr:hypothetical protein [Candidatus Andersenbacteria bacterium]